MCAVADCERPAQGQYCGMHYMRMKRHGTTDAPRGAHGTLRERFGRRSYTITDGGCWEWDGRRNEHGYGMFGSLLAHRVAYRLAAGEQIATSVIRHSCDNPPCVNPAHLLKGTQGDNVKDCIERGRRAPQQGDRNHAAKLSMDIAEQIRAEYAAGGISQEQLGQRYGITQGAVSQIVRHKIWTHTPEES